MYVYIYTVPSRVAQIKEQNAEKNALNEDLKMDINYSLKILLLCRQNPRSFQ